MTSPLQLKPEHLIGKGWHRECYLHPENNTLCIKVVVHGNDRETKREQAYYRQLEKSLTDWRYLSRFHGNVETNMGNGAVFDLIRDANGEVARPLAYYLEDSERFSQHEKSLRAALRALKAYQLQNQILTMSLKPKNILAQQTQDKDMAMFIIDNLGYAERVPFARLFSSLGKAKIRRKWQRFGILLNKMYPHLPKGFTDFE